MLPAHFLVLTVPQEYKQRKRLGGSREKETLQRLNKFKEGLRAQAAAPPAAAAAAAEAPAAAADKQQQPAAAAAAAGEQGDAGGLQSCLLPPTAAGMSWLATASPRPASHKPHGSLPLLQATMAKCGKTLTTRPTCQVGPALPACFACLRPGRQRPRLEDGKHLHRPSPHRLCPISPSSLPGPALPASSPAAAWRIDDYLGGEEEDDDDLDLSSLRRHTCACRCCCCRCCCSPAPSAVQPPARLHCLVLPTHPGDQCTPSVCLVACLLALCCVVQADVCQGPQGRHVTQVQ